MKRNHTKRAGLQLHRGSNAPS